MTCGQCGKEDWGCTCFEVEKTASDSDSPVLVGSMPKIGATVVCKTSQNEHRILITTELQVDMITDLILQDPDSWTIEA